MGFLMILAALLPALLSLIEWLSNRTKLTPNQQRRLDNLYFHMNECTSRMHGMGCVPRSDPVAMQLPDDDENREEHPEG